MKLSKQEKKRDRYKSCKDWTNYNIWRNKCSSIIKMNKKSYINNAVQDRKDPKFLWNSINCCLNNGDSSYSCHYLPSMLRIDDDIITGNENILNALNEHFVSISKCLTKNEIKKENFQHLSFYLNEKLKHKCFDIELITPFEISKIIEKLDINKSAGLDYLGPYIIKLCKDYISVPIASIINSSIVQGIFPDQLKLANVIPIHKGGSKEDANNYRPISILPTLSKIFERHIANQLYLFFQQTNIIYEYQSGFRKQHSCQTALVKIIDSWLKEIDSGKVIGTIFLDFKKAFDLVDHDILLYKLKLYHFSNNAIIFFKSYLSNRKQLIKNGGVRSQTRHIISGVPQGSIIGPLLFLLYVNDLPLKITSGVDMYADDATIHASDCKLEVVQMKLQLSLNETQNWCSINNMIVNPIKTTCMIIDSKHRIKNNYELKLSVGNKLLQNVKSQKLLGVYIDNCLNWSTHINQTCKKLASKLCLLKRISFFLTMEMKQLFYSAYIASTFEYGCIVWSNGNRHDLNRIYKIQKRAARIILKKPIRTPTKDLFHNLKWLSFESRCKYHTALLVYKSIHNLVPKYITDIVKVSNNPRYNLRSSSRTDIEHFKGRTNLITKCFSYTGMRAWNDIPFEIRSVSSIYLFKKHLKTYLFEKQLL
jgi:hypothetical protein